MCCTFLLLKMHEAHFSVGTTGSASPSICISFCGVCDGNLRGMSTPQSSPCVILPLNGTLCPRIVLGRKKKKKLPVLFSSAASSRIGGYPARIILNLCLILAWLFSRLCRRLARRSTMKLYSVNEAKETRCTSS